jgi:hypothetical protein
MALRNHPVRIQPLVVGDHVAFGEQLDLVGLLPLEDPVLDAIEAEVGELLPEPHLGTAGGSASLAAGRVADVNLLVARNQCQRPVPLTTLETDPQELAAALGIEPEVART